MTTNVLSVAVVEPNVPLRDIDGKADFSFKNFTVWDHSQSDTSKPVSVDMTEPKINLLVTVAGEGAFEPGREYKLSGKFSSGEDLNFDDATFSVEQGATSAAVSVCLNGYSSTMPWGVKDSVDWSIDGTHVTKTPIELYAIAPVDVLPPYLQCEIRAEFLELMLTPILKYKLKENYIDYAVRACHGSSEINTLHEYKYDNVNGGPSFTWGFAGDDFDLKLWLINRLDDEAHEKRHRGRQRIATLNCYDQAGLVLIAVPLGLTDTSHALHWYYMDPYGYIDADLVGWGKCNNPYFGNPKCSNEQVTKRSDDPKRSPFENHAFVIMGSRDEGVVLDACAGPHTGLLSLKDYVSRAIDRHNPPEGWEKATWETGKSLSNMGSGIETVSSFPSLDIKSHEKDFLNRLHKISRTSKDKDGHSMSISLANMTKNITAKYPGKQFGEATVDNHDKREITSLTWTSLDGGDITIEMHVFKSYKSVQHAWNAYFLSVNNPPDYLENFEKPEEGTEKGTHHLIALDVIIWISGMIFVKVVRAPSSNTPDTEFKAIADAVHASMLTDPVTSDLKQDLDEISAELSVQNPTVGTEFFITVTASKIGYIQALVVNNRALLMDEEPTRLGEGKWRFQYRALSEGDETVKLVCSHLETFEANVKPFPFRVGAAQ